jgi:hypothetical protein
MSRLTLFLTSTSPVRFFKIITASFDFAVCHEAAGSWCAKSMLTVVKLIDCKLFEELRELSSSVFIFETCY